MSRNDDAAFMLLTPPYSGLLLLDENEEFPASPRSYRGAALVWNLAAGFEPRHLDRAAARPGGLPLMVILPPASEIRRLRREMLEIVERARPHTVLLADPSPIPQELERLLRLEPENLPAEVMEYLWWRGIRIDSETKGVIRKTFELSAETRTLAALAKRVYLSRRALGRRLSERALPVPSHWLQFARQLRALVRLQSSSEPLSRVAHSLGYPDGFTLSNQMHRLVGVRPSTARARLGWEWFLEEWLRLEWLRGGLRIPLSGFPRLTPGSADSTKPSRSVSDSSWRSGSTRGR
jgi:AraC-like DNA-binding protein